MTTVTNYEPTTEELALWGRDENEAVDAYSKRTGTPLHLSVYALRLNAEKALYEPLFNLVKNQDDWKADIDSVVTVTMREATLIREAVAYFTATFVAVIELDDFENPKDPSNPLVKIHVTGTGYRNGPAGP